MNVTNLSSHQQTRNSLNQVLILLLIFGLATITVKFYLVFTSNINWDEFHYLSQIYSYQRGEIIHRLQTFHVHVFGWLTSVQGNEADQIVVARLVLFFLGISTGLCIYLSGIQFLSRTSALFSAVCYFAITNVAWHGASFRPDSICAFLLAASIAALLSKRLGVVGATMAGVCLGLSMMFSIKTVLYGGVFVLIFVAQLFSEVDYRAIIRKYIVLILSFLVTSVVLMLIHFSTVSSFADLQGSSVQSFDLQSIANKVLKAEQLFPRREWLIRSIFENPVIWLLMLLGIFLSLYELSKTGSRTRGVAMLAFASPLLTLLFYRNAFPYYYVFMLPAPILLSGMAIDRLVVSKTIPRQRASIWLGALTIGLAFSYTKFFKEEINHGQRTQREIVELVHQLFPGPVPYIDRNNMISSFYKAGFYMSNWGLESYWEANRPSMRDIIRESRPEFLLANRAALRFDLNEVVENCDRVYYLFCDDYVALREYFVQYWGVLYLPGKIFEKLDPGTDTQFEIFLRGFYTIESVYPVIVDGKEIQTEDSIYLSAGFHSISSKCDNNSVVVRRGKDLVMPERQPTDQPIYRWR